MTTHSPKKPFLFTRFLCALLIAGQIVWSLPASADALRPSLEGSRAGLEEALRQAGLEENSVQEAILQILRQQGWGRLLDALSPQEQAVLVKDPKKTIERNRGPWIQKRIIKRDQLRRLRDAVYAAKKQAIERAENAPAISFPSPSTPVATPSPPTIPSVEPPETSRVHSPLDRPVQLILSRHISSHDGEWAAEQMGRIVEGLEPDRTIVFWAEDLTFYFLLERVIDKLPKLTKTQVLKELSEDSSPTHPFFQQMRAKHKKLEDKLAVAASFIAGEALERFMFSTTNKFLLKVKEALSSLRRGNRKVVFKRESAPFDSVVASIRENTLKRQAIDLFNQGKKDEALVTLGRHLGQRWRSAQLRDQALARQIAQYIQKNPNPLDLHLVVRGKAHGPGLSKFLSEAGVSHQWSEQSPQFSTTSDGQYFEERHRLSQSVISQGLLKRYLLTWMLQQGNRLQLNRKGISEEAFLEETKPFGEIISLLPDSVIDFWFQETEMADPRTFGENSRALLENWQDKVSPQASKKLIELTRILARLFSEGDNPHSSGLEEYLGIVSEGISPLTMVQEQWHGIRSMAPSPLQMIIVGEVIVNQFPEPMERLAGLEEGILLDRGRESWPDLLVQAAEKSDSVIYYGGLKEAQALSQMAQGLVQVIHREPTHGSFLAELINILSAIGIPTDTITSGLEEFARELEAIPVGA